MYLDMNVTSLQESKSANLAFSIKDCPWIESLTGRTNQVLKDMLRARCLATGLVGWSYFHYSSWFIIIVIKRLLRCHCMRL